MKTLTYKGGSTCRLWDGRHVDPGADVTVANDDAATLTERDPDLWIETTTEAPAAAPEEE